MTLLAHEYMRTKNEQEALLVSYLTYFVMYAAFKNMSHSTGPASDMVSRWCQRRSPRKIRGHPIIVRARIFQLLALLVSLSARLT